MSCLDVLYQPYLSQVYQPKHHTFHSQKYGYLPDPTALDLATANRHLSLTKSSPYCLSLFKHHSSTRSGVDGSASFRPETEGNYQNSTGNTERRQTKDIFLSAEKNTSLRGGVMFFAPESSVSEERVFNSARSASLRESVTSDDPSCNTDSEQHSCLIRKQQSPSAHRVSSRCVMFNYFDGKTCDEVDDHFSKALKQSLSPTEKDIPSPMSKRNFPASFWNSEYQHSRPTKANHTSASDTLGPFGLSFPLVSGQKQNFFASGLNSHLSAAFPFSTKFNSYSSSSAITGFRTHLQQTVNAAAAAVGSSTISDPWQTFAGVQPSPPGQNFYSTPGLSNLYGLSPAVMAVAAGQTLENRYNSLLLPQSAASRSFGKEASKFWPVARYSSLRF
ncbi:uncharacterized protein LOC143466127 [Clavelina lepadiformis]|uniref:uncharacterized protein LOC143466127 n=1 Tax=Clavelina lepadiformis TaxID=159417 RepID=UPI0040429E7C